jgi:hypothetical protein
MIEDEKLAKLRELITEGLRVQRDGEAITYINVGHALEDACAEGEVCYRAIGPEESPKISPQKTQRTFESLLAAIPKIVQRLAFCDMP